MKYIISYRPQLTCTGAYNERRWWQLQLTSTSSLVHLMSVMRGTEYSTAMRRVLYPCVTNVDAARVPALLAGRLMTRSNPFSERKSASIHCWIEPDLTSAGHQFNGSIYKHVITYTHTRLTALCPGLQGGPVLEGKTNLDFTEARDSEWQWHQLGHMQVCTSLQTDNHASTPPLSFLQAGCPSCHPTNSVRALKTQNVITAPSILETFQFASCMHSLQHRNRPTC